MANINEFVQRSGAALTGATGQAAPKPLSKEDIQKLSEVVKDPTFDVYVGKKDHMIRKVSGRIEFDVPEESRSALNGIEGGSLDFSVEFARRERRPGDRGAGRGPAAVGAHRVARRQPACSAAVGDQASGTGGGSTAATAPAWRRSQPNGTGTRAEHARRRGLQGLRGLSRQGRAGGHRGPPALQPSCCTG